MTPPNPSRSSVGPGGQRDQEHGVVLQDQEKRHQLLEVGVAKYLKGLREGLRECELKRGNTRERAQERHVRGAMLSRGLLTMYLTDL